MPGIGDKAILFDPGRVEAGVVGGLAFHVEGQLFAQLDDLIPGQPLIRGRIRYLGLVEQLLVDHDNFGAAVPGDAPAFAIIGLAEEGVRYEVIFLEIGSRTLS